jgi:hypothetical protein
MYLKEYIYSFLYTHYMKNITLFSKIILVSVFAVVLLGTSAPVVRADGYDGSFSGSGVNTGTYSGSYNTPGYTTPSTPSQTPAATYRPANNSSVVTNDYRTYDNSFADNSSNYYGGNSYPYYSSGGSNYPRYGGGYSSGYSSGYGYGAGNTYSLGLSYNPTKTVITNTNVNNNGYVPKPITHTPRPSRDEVRCDITASDTSIEEGDSTTLEYETEGDVDEAVINNGVGRVDEDGGEVRVRPRKDTTYRLTVEGRDGSDTCTVTIRVDEEDDDRNSNVTLLSEPTNNRLTSVYISDLPYTGVDLGTFGPLYIALALIAMIGAGYFVMKKTVPALANASTDTITPVLPIVMESVSAPVATEVKAASTLDVHAFVSALLSGDQNEAVDVLEQAIEAGIDAKLFMVRAKNALAQVISHRTNGDYADLKTVALAKDASNETIAEIVNTLGEAIIARA